MTLNCRLRDVQYNQVRGTGPTLAFFSIVNIPFAYSKQESTNQCRPDALIGRARQLNPDNLNHPPPPGPLIARARSGDRAYT